jgi:hypothetical protein
MILKSISPKVAKHLPQIPSGTLVGVDLLGKSLF